MDVSSGTRPDPPIAEGTTPSPSQLADLLANTAAEMGLQLRKIRAGSKHAGLKGGAAEEVVAKFLKDRLPKSLAVTAGHVADADADGNSSRQVDVVIYDALRTPLIFESALGGWNVVPAEGVVAVIEVKMHLTKADLGDVVANCQSVSDLRRDAFIGETTDKFVGYGSTWPELPIHYSVFAFESDNLYADAVNDLQSESPSHKLIDSICYLDRGVSLHYEIGRGRTGYSQMGTPTNLLADVETPNALLIWMTSVLGVAVQAADGRPIDLMRYAEHEHHLSGTLPKTTPERARQRGVRVSAQLLTQFGLDDALATRVAEKVLSNQPLTPAEVTSLNAVGVAVSITTQGGHQLSMPTM